MDELPNDPFLGRDLGGFHLESRIGEGATGIVYRATNPRYSQPLAVKVLHENLGRISSLRRRFEREARALARLAHPGIVHIADFGVADEATFLAMELLHGDTLEDRMQRGPIEPDEILRITKAFLDALGYAHDLQIVHRDLKPANIFLPIGSDAEVKILDFGLAKFLSIEEISSEATLTRRGRIVGTPAYMAPEQITGVALDVRADVYAAGVVLFELLADSRPFDYERRSSLLRAHLFEEVPSLASARPGLSVHPKLEAVVKRALAKDPGRRYADANAMLRAIEALPRESIRLGIAARTRQKRRSRENSSSVVLSEEEMKGIASAKDLGDAAPAAGDDAAPEGGPLGGLPFDELARTPKPTAPASVPLEHRVQGFGAWLLLLALALAAGLVSYMIGKTL